VDCHDDEYEDMVFEWQSESDESISEIRAGLNRVKTSRLTESQHMSLGRIKSGVEKIENDGSQGVHNIELVEQILTEYNEILKTLPQEIQLP
jgi:hypothetical protein